MAPRRRKVTTLFPNNDNEGMSERLSNGSHADEVSLLIK